MFRFAVTILLLFATIIQLPSFAQLSNLRKKKVAATGTIQLDSLSIVPHTFFANDADSSYYFY